MADCRQTNLLRVDSKSQVEKERHNRPDDGKPNRPRNVHVTALATRDAIHTGQHRASLVRRVDEELDDACNAAKRNSAPDDHPSPDFHVERDGKCAIGGGDKGFASPSRDNDLSCAPCVESVQKGKDAQGEGRSEQEEQLEESQKHALVFSLKERNAGRL